MTDKLEKYFFDTFEIDPREFKSCFMNSFCYEGQSCDDSCPHYKTYKIDYPEITDHILLELFVIMTRYTDTIEGFDSIQELKEFVLKDLMYSLMQPGCNIVKHQVRTLFEEG